MIVKDSIANFIGGVSQQDGKLMFPHQSKVLENHLLDTIEGLKRRPATKHIARLRDTLTIHPYIHTWIKEDGKYQVILDGESCSVYNLEGNSQQLYISQEAQPYIQTQSPLTDLYAVTLADYTFILNKTKKVTFTEDRYTNSYEKAALIFVKQGSYSCDYKIIINGVTAASLSTSASTADEIKTTVLATNLANQLSNSLGNTFSITRKGSTILLETTEYYTGDEFTITCEDSRGGENLLCFYKTADTATDLPIVAPDNFILKVVQDATEGSDDYYVKFKTNDGSIFNQGVWSECPSPNINYKLDNTTMPLALVRQADGGFILDVVNWGERLSGDEETAPSPSFIGKTIQEILTYKGRLGLVSGDKIIFSEVNDIFSFFKKTILTELDTDPIDIASNSKMVLLKHTLPFNQELMVASETAQFMVKGGDSFSNSTVSIDLATSYQCSKDCKPISIGANGYFVYENGAYTRVMGLFITDNLTVDAEDITEQCPSYLPNNVYKLVGSTANHTMIVLSTEERNSLYVYNFYTKGTQRGQSAWHKWIFNNAKILNADFDKHLLYLTIQYEDGIFLETIDFTPKAKDFELNYLLYLDRKVKITSLSEDERGSYFTLPYEVSENNFKVVDSRGFSVKYNIDDDKCYINANRLPVMIGYTFQSKWELPTIYVRMGNENSVKVQEGLLMLRDMNLTYANSGYFIVTINPKYTTQMESQFKFTGKIIGLPSATIGKTPIESGVFLVPVIAKNEDITITITNDSYLPSCFLSLEWLGDFVQRGK